MTRLFGGEQGEFRPDELVILNIYGPEPDETDDDPQREYYDDGWANRVCQAADESGTLSAPDYDGTTTGSQNGINVLTRRADLPIWEQVAANEGCRVAHSPLAVTAGHYGDGQWNGVDLVDRDGKLVWIEK